MYVSQMNTHFWTGISGKDYKYEIYPIGADFKPMPGNYVMAKRNLFGLWEPLYVGETEDLYSRFRNHHAMQCAVQRGATHIHAHIASNIKRVRLAEETDLRHYYDPPCNKQ